MKNKAKNGPKILFVDIETAPIIGYVWSLWDNNLGLNQVKADWHLLSWAAKWSDSNKIMYMDQRKSKRIDDDSEILKGIWKLLDEADIVIGQNSKKFDTKKLNARFVLNGMQPPSSYRQIDTVVIARKHFAFTSNKLEYLTDKLCIKYKKLKHKKFPGQEMWTECLKGNKKAWEEMKKYNIHDVLAVEELYHILKAWDNSINFNVYTEGTEHVCSCGSKDFKKKGFHYTETAKFQRHKCKNCGAEIRERVNMLPTTKKASLKRKIVR